MLELIEKTSLFQYCSQMNELFARIKKREHSFKLLIVLFRFSRLSKPIELQTVCRVNKLQAE